MTKRTRSGRMKFMRYDCDRCECNDAQEFEHDSKMVNWFGFCPDCYEEMDKEAEGEFTESQKKIAKQGMDEKDEVTATYRKEHPELSEGAETVKEPEDIAPAEKVEEVVEEEDDNFEEEMKK